MTTPASFDFAIEDQDLGKRLDKILAKKYSELSRSRLKDLILEGQVKLDEEKILTPSFIVKSGEFLNVKIPEAKEYNVEAENIPLNVVYEDDDLLVINKEAGLVVHPGAGNWNGTLVHALLHHCGDSLSGIGGVMRPGIIHRLDKETSGLMIVAKNDHAHQYLSAQLADRSLSRTYVALVVGQIQPVTGKIDFPLGRHPRDRVKIAIRNQGGKDAVTHYKLIEYFGEALSLVECKLETGRTHQIRVHMEGIKHPLIGDPLYGEQPTRTNSLLKKSGYDKDIREKCLNFPRQALHAKEIAFIHPRSEEEMSFNSDLSIDMQDLVKLLKNNN